MANIERYLLALMAGASLLTACDSKPMPPTPDPTVPPCHEGEIGLGYTYAVTDIPEDQRATVDKYTWRETGGLRKIRLIDRFGHLCAEISDNPMLPDDDLSEIVG